MRPYFLFILLICALSAPSLGAQVYEFDGNGDGKSDFRAVFSKDGLVSKQVDYNLDGKFDYIYTFDYSKMEFTEKRDGDHDGKFEILNIGRFKERGYEVSRFKVDGGKSTLKGKNFQQILEGNQADCVRLRENTLSYFENFAGSFQKILDTQLPDFHQIGNSLSVHKSCYKNFSKKEFDKQVKKAVNRGMSCLQMVAKQKVRSQRRAEIFNLLDMFKIHYENKAQTTQVACSDNKLSWSSTKAYGSVRPGTHKGERELTHPFVILNPGYEEGFFGLKYDGYGVDDEDFQGVIFHEMVHNMGYSHGNGLDLAYGCEECCFSNSKLREKDLAVDAENPACRLCAGDYPSELSDDYIKDLALMEADSDTFAFLSLIAERRGDIDWNDNAMSSLLEYYSGRNSAFAKMLFKELEPLLQNEELKAAWRGRTDELNGGRDSIQKFNQELAKFMVTVLVKNDEHAALEELGKVDLNALRASRSSGGTFGMAHDQKISDSISTFLNFSAQLKEHVGNEWLKIRIQLVREKSR